MTDVSSTGRRATVDEAGVDGGQSGFDVDPHVAYAMHYRGGVVARFRARLRLRVRTLADLRYAPPLAVAVIVVALAAVASVPALSAMTLGVVLDGLAAGDLTHAGGAVAFLVGLLVGEQLAVAVVGPVQTFARARIDESVREWLRLALSGRPGIDALEDQSLRDDADVLTRWLGTWTYGEGVEGQIHVFFRVYVAWALCGIVIARFSVWLAVVTIAITMARYHYLMRMYRRGTAIVMSQVPLRRAARYWGDVAGRPETAKELRTFGFGSWVVEHQHRIVRRMHQLSFDYVLRILPRQWPSFVLGGATFALAGYVVFEAGIRGDASVAAIGATLAAVTGAQSARAGEAPFAYEAARLIDAARCRVGDGAATRCHGALLAVDGPPDVVRFEGVTFTYPGAELEVLAGVDLEIRRGESLAIVGQNGSGKTTLIKLLAGLYAPTDGRVVVDGRDMRGLDLASWRANLAVVFQDFTRFELTVAENVGLIDVDDVDPVRLVQALAAARASQLVDRLPAGPATLLGRRYTTGADLSGGEWQRIALARALYALEAGRRVLILDEPTAGLDVTTELEIFNTVLARASDAAVIVLSHRFSTVRRADRIAVLDHGRVMETGTHEQLLRLDGRYAQMYTSQARLAQGPDDG